MSNCNCTPPCSPCASNCPDDGEILNVEILDPEDCNTNCCWKTCNDNCWINIQSTSDCLVVDTSECWVVKLTAICPKPTYVKAWSNVTVRDVTPPDDCYIDGWDCWVKWWWEINATDEKVKACSGDTTPGFLIDKLQEWNWIIIDPIWCDGSTNSKIKISIDEDILPECPTIPEITVTDNSQLINVSASWHHIVVSDQDNKAYYAKMVLAANKTFSRQWNDIREYCTDGTWEWKPISSSTADIRQAFNKNLQILPRWWIRITKKWLYHIWFSGSMEINYWMHAFRMQLYRYTSWNYKTVLESRRSAPLWREIWEDVMSNAWKIRAVTWVSWWGEEGWVSTTYWEWLLSYPLVWQTTEANWQQWHSQSMWACLDRVPVNWDTIAEMEVWDVLVPWIKMSTSISHSWMLNNIPHVDWQMTLLWSDASDWDNGWECGFSFFADLIHPILS